ncbi:MAG: PAS domain-containing sensor histidine kinase, partial [bacterium]
MRVPFLKGSSIFRKLFVLAFLVAVVPIGLSWLYFFYAGKGIGDQSQLSLVFYGLFALTLILAGSGAYYFSLQISRPITQFKNSALEIARGNFDHKINLESDDEIGKLAKIFDYMIEEFRKKHIQGSLSEKKQIDTILQGTGDGVIVTDSQNKILQINAVAARWFKLGETKEKKPIRELIGAEELVKCIEEISKCGKKKSATIEVTTIPESESKPRTLQALASRIEDDENVATISDEQNRLIGVATILRDITREKEIDRLKTELVSLVAHELRSPLTCISGFSELLLDPGITRSQSEEYSAIILKESNRLSDLINKFLDISKIEAGKSQLRKTPV